MGPQRRSRQTLTAHRAHGHGVVRRQRAERLEECGRPTCRSCAKQTRLKLQRPAGCHADGASGHSGIGNRELGTRRRRCTLVRRRSFDGVVRTSRAADHGRSARGASWQSHPARGVPGHGPGECSPCGHPARARLRRRRYWRSVTWAPGFCPANIRNRPMRPARTGSRRSSRARPGRRRARFGAPRRAGARTAERQIPRTGGTVGATALASAANFAIRKFRTSIRSVEATGVRIRSKSSGAYLESEG